MKVEQVVYITPDNYWTLDDFLTWAERDDPDTGRHFYVTRWIMMYEDPVRRLLLVRASADFHDFTPAFSRITAADLSEIPPDPHESLKAPRGIISSAKFTLAWRIETVGRTNWEELVGRKGTPLDANGNAVAWPTSFQRTFIMLDALEDGSIGRDIDGWAYNTSARAVVDWTTREGAQSIGGYQQFFRPPPKAWEREDNIDTYFVKQFGGRLPQHTAVIEITGGNPTDHRVIAPTYATVTSQEVPRPGNITWAAITLEHDDALTPLPVLPDNEGEFSEATRDRIPDIQVLGDGPVEALKKAYEVAVGPVLWLQEQVALVDYDSEDVGGQVNRGTVKLIAQVAGSYAVGVGAAKAFGGMTREKLRNAIETQAVKWAQRTVQIGLIKEAVDTGDWVQIARILAPYVPEVDFGITEDGVRVDIGAPDGENLEEDCAAVLGLLGLQELIAECGEAFDKEVDQLELVDPAMIVPGYISDGGNGWLLERLEEGDSGYIDELAG